MSDFLPAVQTDAPTPEFLSRLREGRFVSPSGTESAFLFDTLTRSAGKKVSSHEIPDSNDAVLQDLGTGTIAYPMGVYFIGGNYDVYADVFADSLLKERYTPDKPGILHHPRWGDIPVMPVSVDQAETFAGTGVGIAKFNVEFRQTKSLTAPASDGYTQSLVNQSTDELRDEIENAADGIDVSSASAYSRFRAGVRSAISTVSDAIEGISDKIGDVQSEVDAITQDLYSALDLAASPAIIMGQLGNLVFGVADVVFSTPDRFNAYADMTRSVIESYRTRYESMVGADDKKVAAESLQMIGAILVNASAIALLNTDFETRDAVGEAIDSLVDSLLSYRDEVDAVQAGLSGPISEQFIPDHNLQSQLAGIVAATTQVAINRAFDLKAKRAMRLAAPSDAITLTWELYGDLEKLDFFSRTNRITDNEFWEIPSGREIVAYV